MRSLTMEKQVKYWNVGLSFKCIMIWVGFLGFSVLCY